MGYGYGPYGHTPYGRTPVPWAGVANPYAMPAIIAPPASLATPQAALDARATDTRGVLYVGGVLTPYLPGLRADFRIGDAATARITLPLPRPAHVVPNATIEWQSGHNDLVGTTLSGFVPDFSFAMSRQGDTLELIITGWKHRLTKPFRDDLVYPGPVKADTIYVDLCERAGVPAYIAETTLMPNGSPLMLGGNPQIDDGNVVIKANSSPIGQFERLVNPFYYYVTDFPIGATVLHRVLGKPSHAPVVSFVEGVHLGDTRRPYATSGIVNVWDVRGPNFPDAYGGEVSIRSIADPATVPPHPEIPDGYTYKQTSNSDFVRQDLADGAREALEIEHSAADAPIRFDGVGIPGIAPGDAIAIDCETVEASGRYWLVSLSLTDSESGLLGSYEARAGAGASHPGIVDRIEIPVFSAPVHLGDESVPWYAVPAPQGLSKQWPITLPVKATAVNVRGIAHSWNSQLIGGANKDLNVSKWEIWKPGVDQNTKDNRPETSGSMPVMNEDYLSRPNYKSFATWAPFAINLSRLDAGDYLLKFVCGENTGDKAGYDDGELANVYLECFGLTEAAGGEQ